MRRKEVKQQLKLARLIAPKGMERLINLAIRIEDEIDLIMSYIDYGRLPRLSMLLDLRLLIDELLKESISVLSIYKPEKVDKVKELYKTIQKTILTKELGRENFIINAYKSKNEAGIFSYFITSYIEIYSNILDSILSGLYYIKEEFKDYVINNFIERVGTLSIEEKKELDIIKK